MRLRIRFGDTGSAISAFLNPRDKPISVLSHFLLPVSQPEGRARRYRMFVRYPDCYADVIVDEPEVSNESNQQLVKG
jgi:hypothetical protein